jgi:hypothetical protein
MDPLSVFPLSETDQEKIWSQSKRLLQESASPVGTFEIEKKCADDPSSPTETSEERKSLKSESLRHYFNRSIEERSELQKSVMKYQLKRLSQKPKILGSALRRERKKKTKVHGFESPKSKLGLVKTVYETTMKKGYQPLHRSHPKLDAMREEKFSKLQNELDEELPKERTRDLSTAVKSKSVRSIFPPRHEQGAKELLYPSSESETLKLNQLGIDLTERELAESTTRIMESVPIGKSLPSLGPLQERPDFNTEKILSKWRLPNGKFEWREAKLLAKDEMLDRYLIEWCHRPELRKEVRRVNIVRDEDDAKRREVFVEQAQILRKRKQRAVKLGLHLPFMLEALRTRHIMDSSVHRDFRLEKEPADVVSGQIVRHLYVSLSVFFSYTHTHTHTNKQTHSSTDTNVTHRYKKLELETKVTQERDEEMLYEMCDEIESDYLAAMERAHAEIILMSNGGPMPVATWKQKRKQINNQKLDLSIADRVSSFERNASRLRHVASIYAASLPFRAPWQTFVKEMLVSQSSPRTIQNFVKAQRQVFHRVTETLTGVTAKEVENVVFDAYIDTCDVEKIETRFTPSGVVKTRVLEQKTIDKSPWRKLLFLSNMIRWEMIREVGLNGLNYYVKMFEVVYNSDLPLMRPVGDREMISNSSRDRERSRLTSAVVKQIRAEYRSGGATIDSVVEPLFKLKLTFQDSKLEFSPSLSDFEDSVKTLVTEMCNVLKSASSSKSLRVSAIEESSVPKTTNSSPLSLKDTIVKKSLKRILLALRTSFSALNALRSELSKLQYLCNVDHTSYLDEFLSKTSENESEELNAWKSELERQHSIAEKVCEIVPNRVKLGLFELDCSSLQKRMLHNSHDLISELTDRLHGSVKRRCESMRQRFTPVIENLRSSPKTYTEFSSLVHTLRDIDKHLDDASQGSHIIWHKMQLFHGLRLNLCDKDFTLFIEAAAWPKRIQASQNQLRDHMSKLKLKFARLLTNESNSFRSKFQITESKLLDLVGHGLEDRKRAIEFAADASQLIRDLDQTHKDAQTLNIKRDILGLEPLDVSWLECLRITSHAVSDMWDTFVDWTSTRFISLFFSLSLFSYK